ncbi:MULTISPECIES: hypothetical protein [Xenorhabdus]|uniref:Uncharacterized protein n=1 Tax=Xenorhabdus ehlersii TaxID=290111 RepID=A0A2D0IL08_9GAMM|nr:MULTISPECIES: hypothetical protein [Xenorhabdus]MBC8948411.1 hypothetical protein [Xenorhabdus sp. TS4]PHM22463.1 hypothetical protein Xehl_03609 [Xenorhabdus ehlersii]RKE88703.1 hypothetical protein BDE27_3355 [Xenorhabdus ehlersii]
MNKSKSTSVVTETDSDCENENTGGVMGTVKEIDFGEDFREPRVVSTIAAFEENTTKSRSRKLTKNMTRTTPRAQLVKGHKTMLFSGGSKHTGTKSKKCKRKQGKKNKKKGNR